MGVAALAVSAVLLIATALRLARGVGRTSAERFFLAVGTGTLTVGAIATLLSLRAALTPIPFLGCQAVLFLAALRFVPAPARKRPSSRRRLSRADKLLIAALVAAVLVTGFEQFFLAVSNIDDRNYRASRAAYWRQHQSIFGWETHNDRQVAFPPGGSLPFFYALLFTRNETAGLMITWSAFPLVAGGAYLLLRSLRQTRTVSLLGTTAFCFTPIVLLHTRGVQPELWLTLYTLGCAFWSTRSLRRGRRGLFACAAAGAFACLAVNVRATALPVVIVTSLLPLLRRRHRLRGVAAALGGGVAALMLSGLLPTLAFNVAESGHPLGSQSFRDVHSADTSFLQLRVHAARAFVTLLELPFVPEAMRTSLQRMVDATAAGLGADVKLPREDQPWPGPYTPQAGRWAESYSLLGLLVITVLAVASFRTLGALRRARVGPVGVLTLLAVPFFIGVIFMVRWMGVMERFWIAPYALTVVLGTMLLARPARRRQWVAIAVACLAGIVAVPAALHRAGMLRDITTPQPTVALDAPYAEALAHIPPGSRILLAAGQATRDYPLFAPRDAFENRVISWGKQPFDAAQMQQLLDRHDITHVIVEDDREVLFEWAPPVPTGAMVSWLSQHPPFRPVPMEYSPNMRLFVRRADAN